MTTWFYTSPIFATEAVGTTQVKYLSTIDMVQAISGFSTEFIIGNAVVLSTLGIYGGVLQANNTNWIFGKITLGANGHSGFDLINVGSGTTPANLVNYGTIDFLAVTRAEIKATSTASVITNNGLIKGGAVKIDPAVVGVGTLSFYAPYTPVGANVGPVCGIFEFASGVGLFQTIDFANGGAVILDDLRDFHASIKNFTAAAWRTNANNSYNLPIQDTLDVKGKYVTDTTYSGNSQHGSLKLLSGSTVLGTVNFTGNYTHSHFTIAHSGSDSLIHLG